MVRESRMYKTLPVQMKEGMRKIEKKIHLKTYPILLIFHF